MTDAYYTLSLAQLREVCAQFAAIMMWTPEPGGEEWAHRLAAYGSPEAFHTSLTVATRQAVDKAAEEDNTSLEALYDLRRRYGGTE
jgi:hypothetical protein